MDVAPPTKAVLARIKDTRALQFWDRSRLTSDAFVRSVAENPDWVKSGDPKVSWGSGVVYDMLAVFPKGAHWEKMIPAPAISAYPALAAMERLEKMLDSGTR